MKWLETLNRNRLDGAIAVALGVVTLLLLLPGLSDPGVTWDEAAPNIPAAKNQARWLSSLGTLDAPFSQETIDEYWFTTSDHPSLPRTLAAVSWLLFSGLVDELVALRLPSALGFTLLVMLLFVFLRMHLSQWGAVAGALSLVMMPRIFGHAHLFSLDLPIMVMWCAAALTGYAVLKGWMAPWLFGVVYALAFSTKLHAVFLPFPLLAWVGWMVWSDRDQAGVYLKRLGWAVLSSLILLPVLYIGLQPWLWHDTGIRIVERFFDYSRKASTNPIPLYYFGEIYGTDTPWHYPLVMLAFTLPVVLLALFLMGLVYSAWRIVAHARTRDPHVDASLDVYLWLCMSAPLSLVLLPLAQAYDGVRLFLPCFPFVACLIGAGVEFIVRGVSVRVPAWRVLLPVLLAMTMPVLYTYSGLHPHYLAYYNSLAGGIRGAHALGMETTYWCDSITREFLDSINEVAPPNATLRPHSMQFAAMDYYKERGWLRPDIQHETPPPYDLHVLHARQGMFRNPEWLLYLRREPIAAVEVDGVMLVGLYGPVDDETRVR